MSLHVAITQERVSLVVRSNPSFIIQSLDSLRALVRRADEFRVPRHSKMFLWTLYSLRKVSQDIVNTKFKLLMKFGLTESEILTAFGEEDNSLIPCCGDFEVQRVVCKTQNA
ncbi:hypothetical protein ZIOFF_034259 [Zingiber officinale]|uniref:Uncharacterized protein n=1 Tax=Zingiber officinale TaxID=94328 RepID=A0A8J5GP82_ZINOF|nr:hypothetical protein ZIOFF_034259 [Zingiber officinale]